MSVLSFHVTKIFNTIEGGAIICKDEKNVSVFIENSLTVICSHLNIKVPFVNSQSWNVELDDSSIREEMQLKDYLN